MPRGSPRVPRRRGTRSRRASSASRLILGSAIKRRWRRCTRPCRGTRRRCATRCLGCSRTSGPSVRCGAPTGFCRIPTRWCRPIWSGTRRIKKSGASLTEPPRRRSARPLPGSSARPPRSRTSDTRGTWTRCPTCRGTRARLASGCTSGSNTRRSGDFRATTETSIGGYSSRFARTWTGSTRSTRRRARRCTPRWPPRTTRSCGTRASGTRTCGRR